MVKNFTQFRKELEEDVAVNSAVGGHIAGIGIGAHGEPGVSKRTGSKMLRRKAPMEGVGEHKGKRVLPEGMEDGSISLNIPVLLRMLEIAREKIKSDDELHAFVENLMELDSPTGTLTMDDVEKVFSKYSD